MVMIKLYQTVLVIAFLGLNVCKVLSQDEDSKPHYEYIQIFKSIPTLFEYLLNALEERPEILEKNDISVFSKRSVDDSEKNEYEGGENETRAKHVTYYSNSRNEEGNQNSVTINKRGADNSKDIVASTVAYEYGNSNVVMKKLEEDNLDVSKRFVGNQDSNADKNIHANREVEEKLGKNDETPKLNDNGEVFLGFENFFGLDLKIEDIEERMLSTEKMLEKHNHEDTCKKND